MAQNLTFERRRRIADNTQSRVRLSIDQDLKIRRLIVDFFFDIRTIRGVSGIAPISGPYVAAIAVGRKKDFMGPYREFGNILFARINYGWFGYVIFSAMSVFLLLGSPTDKWASVVERDFYVAVDDELVVGTGMLTVAIGQVDAISVRPSHMGHGIGRKMLQSLEALACYHGIASIRLDATLNAAPFYRYCGWSGESISTYRTSRGLELACVPMTKCTAPA